MHLNLDGLSLRNAAKQRRLILLRIVGGVNKAADQVRLDISDGVEAPIDVDSLGHLLIRYVLLVVRPHIAELLVVVDALDGVLLQLLPLELRDG